MMWINIGGKIEHVINLSGIAAIRRGIARPAYKNEIEKYFKEREEKREKA